MKVNFGFEFKSLSGDKLRFNDKEATLKDISLEALLATFDDEKNLPGVDKARRYSLATRIYSNSDVDLTSEEVSEIKKVIGKGFGPLIVGQAYNVLDQKV